MYVLTELVRNVMLIILLTTFLDMIMPSSSMQRFVKVIMGLFVLIAILNPILNLINEEQDLEAFVWQLEEPSQLQVNSILENSTRFQKANQDLVWENYRKKIEKEMESLVKTVPGVEKVEVTVKFAEAVNIDAAQSLDVVTVSVGLSSNKVEDKGRGTELIKKILSQYFKLNDEQVNILFI